MLGAIFLCVVVQLASGNSTKNATDFISASLKIHFSKAVAFHCKFAKLDAAYFSLALRVSPKNRSCQYSLIVKVATFSGP